MTDQEVLELFRDEERFFRLVSQVFPSGRFDRKTVFDIMETARRSGDPLVQHLGPGKPLSPEAQKALERQNGSGGHTLYRLEAGHSRDQPFQSAFVEECQAVRVTLPQKPSQEHAIWTHLGVVKAHDHKLFSVEEFKADYQRAFGEPAPTVARVDLVTGARYLDLVRFSPISIYFAYEKEADERPSFFFLESGSVTGRPEVLYYAKDMTTVIHAEAGFAFTPFACAQNWYKGTLTMTKDGIEPESVLISVAQEKDGQRHYLDVFVGYQVAKPGNVICPGTQAIVAVMRVFAIGLGLQFERGVIERAVGEWCCKQVPWKIEPPLHGSPDGYCGCPDAQELN